MVKEALKNSILSAALAVSGGTAPVVVSPVPVVAAGAAAVALVTPERAEAGMGLTKLYPSSKAPEIRPEFYDASTVDGIIKNGSTPVYDLKTVQAWLAQRGQKGKAQGGITQADRQDCSAVAARSGGSVGGQSTVVVGPGAAGAAAQAAVNAARAGMGGAGSGASTLSTADRAKKIQELAARMQAGDLNAAKEMGQLASASGEGQTSSTTFSGVEAKTSMRLPGTAGAAFNPGSQMAYANCIAQKDQQARAKEGSQDPTFAALDRLFESDSAVADLQKRVASIAGGDHDGDSVIIGKMSEANQRAAAVVVQPGSYANAVRATRQKDAENLRERTGSRGGL